MKPIISQPTERSSTHRSSNSEAVITPRCCVYTVVQVKWRGCKYRRCHARAIIIWHASDVTCRRDCETASDQWRAPEHCSGGGGSEAIYLSDQYTHAHGWAGSRPTVTSSVRQYCCLCFKYHFNTNAHEWDTMYFWTALLTLSGMDYMAQK